MISSNRLIAYHTGPITHLDHLGVLAIEFNIPLVTSDPFAIQAAKTFYPELDVHYIEDSEALPFLTLHCDALLGCGKFWAMQLKQELSVLFNKSMRMVFCPHGNSDKGRTLQDGHPSQDIALLYGQQMYDLWQRTGVLKVTHSTLFTGNYRWSHYQKRQDFYTQLLQPILHQLDQNRKTIFYAPSWPDHENPSPFLSICDQLITSLDSRFNLIIKLHPLIEEYYPAETYRFLGRFENHPQVVLIKDFPLVYPLLQASHIYLGDYSSVGYDALAFDLPLYFLIEKEHTLEHSALAQAGMCISTSMIDQLYSIIDGSYEKNSADFRKKRLHLYQYAFGTVKSSDSLLNELTMHLSS
ncbi:MAG: CDP-glycerol glycerophosphotransferase family protein [Simkania sp.]|nr:CDP-glycerol glycerophosphotransferase family protein [Simkania sp.]